MIKRDVNACLLVLAALAAGCAPDRDVTPTRTDPVAPPPITVPHSATAPRVTPTSTGFPTRFANLLPPRSRELDLAGVDPCTDLLTNQQLRELDYDLGYTRPPLPDHSDFHGGPDCTFASNGGDGGPSRNITSLVGVSTTEGAMAWVTDPARQPDTRPEVVDIQGFSALVLLHPKFVDDCLIVVDTAEGQYLEVASSPNSGKGTTAEPFCAEAERVAGMAIQTVSASR